MATETKQKVAPKGTPKTEVVVGTAALKISNATKSLNEAIAASATLVNILEENTIRIADSEMRLGDLEVQYGNKKAQQDFQLDLEYKQSKENFTRIYLSENGLSAIPTADYQALQTKYDNLKRDFDQNLNAEVGKQKGMMQADFNNQTKLKEAEFAMKEAQNLAEIKQLTSQIANANAQSEMWRQQLVEERKAGVERAQASSIGTISVGTNGK